MRYLSKHFKHLRPMIPGGRGSLMDQKFEIRLRRVGCANRPSYSIDVFKTSYPDKPWVDSIEQLGVYDPLINKYGETLCSLNIERITYYLSQGIELEENAAKLLGLAGLLPQHPDIYRLAWRNRRELTRQLPPETEEQAQS
ncbi:small ribosomal subunit protein bS16m-like [Tigriopus californicus]|uniref:small ribosomal subunit protein bS16m-like n=1 Tax=Tigriopus californicus TaxID=6832 RepID=UPI0027DA6822|nr:small ribosomal subunit protein bS16m-like [Tigriopus californicus]